jgi:hypothetical protein
MKKRSKSSFLQPLLREVGRSAALRALLDEGHESDAPKPARAPLFKRREAQVTSPPPGARNYKVTLLVGEQGKDTEAVQIEAPNAEEAKRHAAAVFLSTPGAIGVLVRGVDDA